MIRTCMGNMALPKYLKMIISLLPFFQDRHAYLSKNIKVALHFHKFEFLDYLKEYNLEDTQKCLCDIQMDEEQAKWVRRNSITLNSEIIICAVCKPLCKCLLKEKINRWLIFFKSILFL